MYIDRLEVNFENKPCYDIVISDDFSNLRDELVKLDIEKKKICIVSNSLIYYKNTKEWEDLVKTAEIYFNNAEGQ